MHDPKQFRAMHRARFKAEPAVFAGPGRVNLIGEHTDYAEGFVMPAAINFATLAGISPRTDGKIAIYSENQGEERVFEGVQAARSNHWTDYPMGVTAILAGEGHKIPGFNLSIWSDVPLSSGLSSSAALEVATALAVLSLAGASYPGPQFHPADKDPSPGARLARLCQRAENEFVGANCGIMDQFISINAQKDHALLLDCRDLSFKLAPIPGHVALVIANTMVKHSVAGGDYPTRRRESEAACAVIAGHKAGVRFLRDCTLEDLEKWRHEMEPKSYLRAKHVIGENLRTVAACEALLRGDMKELGRLMAEAHRSYSRDFEGSCVEADQMVALATDLPGLIGARLTGGGFGGCTINLVEQAEAAAFARALGERYAEKTGIVPQIHVCHASDGARRLE